METKATKGGLTITVAEKATLGLYLGLPTTRSYFSAIDPNNAIKPTEVSTYEGVTSYYYDGLETGLYHYGASMDGYTASCQIINYTEEKKKSGINIEVALYEMLGNGYESGFTMQNTEEFIAAALSSEKNSWGEEYARLFVTPQFSRSADRPGRHQETTNEEIYAFIEGLKKKCDYMHVYSLGRSPKYDFDMPLVLFTREKVEGLSLSEAAEVIRKNGKPTVQYAAQVHSNEPASTEGALAMMNDLTEDYGKRVLDKVDIYVIPRINLDGAVEVIRTSPTTGDDMNRDYLFMNNREIRMVVSAYNLFLPELVVDGHEKFSPTLVTDENRCNDMELQVGAGSLNHPAIMTETGMKIALKAIAKATSIGLRAHFYQSLASAAGGSAGSSYFGTRNSLSFLVETPGGTTLGGFGMARRVMAQYILASTVISYAAENAEEVMKIVHESRDEMVRLGAIYDEKRLMVLEHDKAPTGTLTVTMIDVPTGRVTETELETEYTEHVVALHTRPRPTAYVMPKGLKNEEEILRVVSGHAIPYYELPAESSVSLIGYKEVEDGIETGEEKEVILPNGAYAFPSTVPSTVLGVIMEPDFNSVSKRKMSLYSMGLIEADGEKNLPVYRFCHDLVDGKIPSDI